MAPSSRAGLQSEALALVDLLVLVHARRFTGFGSSTFSWVVQEYRHVAYPRCDDLLVEACEADCGGM